MYGDVCHVATADFPGAPHKRGGVAGKTGHNAQNRIVLVDCRGRSLIDLRAHVEYVGSFAQ